MDYVEAHGDARVPQSYIVDGYKLSVWVNTQRTTYGRDKLDADRERRLQGVRGWTWDPFADDWEEGFHRLLSYVNHHGDARVPGSYTVSGYRLGAWVNKQRTKHSKGTLDVDRQRRLQKLTGWTWKA